MELCSYPYQVHTAVLPYPMEIAYIDEGAGDQVIVFLHGLGSNLKVWQKNIEVLSKHFRCIALDLPGYGLSEKNLFPFDMTFFSQAVYQSLKTLGLRKVILVGHSMGGQIATHLVLNYKNLVEQLILIAPAGFETFSEEEAQLLNTIYKPNFLKGLSTRQIIRNIRANFYKMPRDARFMINERLLLRQSDEYTHYCKMVPRCIKGMLYEPVFDELASITLPTLVLYGENDRLIPNPLIHPTLSVHQVALEGYQQFMDSKLIMIPRAGHLVQWEQAALVNYALVDFLEPALVEA